MPRGVTLIPMVILGIIFVRGLIDVINPRIMWRIFESWKATKEPTNAFFMSRRIVGIVMMLIVIIFFIFPYFFH